MTNLRERILNKKIPAIAAAFAADCSSDKIKALKKQGLDIAEIRVDLFTQVSADKIIQILQKFSAVGVSTILTCRSKKEAGGWNGSDLARAELLAKCYQYADIVDIESSSIHPKSTTSAQFCQLADEISSSKTQLLISYHNFDKTPSLKTIEDEFAAVEKLLPAKIDIIKVAVQVYSNADIAILTALLLQNSHKNMVVIGMGDFGMLTRISFAAYGSLFTFAHINEITAPGQMDIEKTNKYLRLFYPTYGAKK